MKIEMAASILFLYSQRKKINKTKNFIMKKVLLIIAVFSIAACNQSKIAYIDVAELMEGYEATIALEAELLAKQEAKAKELDSISAPFQLKVQEYYQNANNMSESKRTETEQALQQEQQLLQMQQQQAANELQQEQQEKSEVISKRVDSVVAAYAKKNGIQLILGTQGNGTVIYGEDALNITDEMIAVLNEK